jgi:hypothetical protein
MKADQIRIEISKGNETQGIPWLLMIRHVSPDGTQRVQSLKVESAQEVAINLRALLQQGEQQ